MKSILKRIEKECNASFKIQISGINFELNCQEERKKLIGNDMFQYLPRNAEYKKINVLSTKGAKIYYIIDNLLFEEMRIENYNKDFKSIVVYQKRTFCKGAYFYDYGKIRVFFCEQEPYYVCTIEDKIYVILCDYTKNLNRLYFRLMLEFILRAKELMGYHLIHAASVSIDNKGLLICGEKGAGKTTLMSHLLNSGKANFIANDKVFLSPDLSTLEYFPIVARIGEGTLRKFAKYDLQNNYHRISEEEKKIEKENLGNDKWNFTPVEMAKIFSCEYKSMESFVAVLFSKIGKDTNESLIPVDGDVLQFDLFLSGSMKVENWLLNDEWIEYYSNMFHIQPINNHIKYKSYEINYNYDSESNSIVNDICKIL